MMEKVPVIMAWLPTTAARIATPSTGHLKFSAISNSNFRFDTIFKALAKNYQGEKNDKQVPGTET